MQELIDMGADIHLFSSKGNVANANAIRGTPQDWALLKKLAQRKIDLQRFSSYNYSSILQTIASHPSDDSSMIEFLLEYGADMDDKQIFSDGHGNTSLAAFHSQGPALQHACYQGNIKIVSLLLDRGSRKNFGDCTSGTPLQEAIRGQHRQIVDLLLENHVDVNAVSGIWGTALEAAIYMGDRDMMCHLLENGAQVNKGGGSRGSPLSAAIELSQWDLAEMLLDRGASPNGIIHSEVCDTSMVGAFEVHRYNVARVQPINSAISVDNIEMVIKLLERGTNLNAIHDRCARYGVDDAHPLCHALNNDRKGIIDILVANGAEVTTGNYCPILTALSKNDVEKFREFMEGRTNSISNPTLEEMLLRSNGNELVLAV